MISKKDNLSGIEYLFPNYLKGLIKFDEIKDTQIRICDIKDILKKIRDDLINTIGWRGAAINKLSVYLKTPRRTVNGWLGGNSLITLSKLFDTINFWGKICNKSETEKKRFIEEIFGKNSYFSIAKGKKVKLPKKVTIKLAYLLGYLLGDGCLTDFRKAKTKRGISTYPIQLAFDMMPFVDKVLQPYFMSTFGIKGKIYTLKNNGCMEFLINSKVLYVFLNKFCEVPIGKKKGQLIIPSIILNSSNKIKRWFIAGLFDADGLIYIKNKEVSITQADPIFLEDVSSLINGLGIETRRLYKAKKEWGVTYSLSMRWNSIKKFLINIPLQHPKRIKNAELLSSFVLTGK